MFSASWVKVAIAQLPKGSPNPYDIMATLSQLTADTIAQAIQQVNGGRWTVDGGRPPSYAESSADKTAKPQQLYLSGGGAHNPLILKYLRAQLPSIKIFPMKKLGIDGDAKEAVLFAVLANETVAGSLSEGPNLGGIPLVGMGKISLPG